MSGTVSRPNGGDVLVQAMRDAGTDVAFGVVSVHNLPLVDAVHRDLRWVPTRSEAAAVNAADGWARATGRVGVAVTSTGTGAGNACGALVEALTAGSSVVHVTGQVPSSEMGRARGHIHDFTGQLDLLRSVSVHAETVGRSEASAAEALAGAFGRAGRAPRGPVSIEWPIDLQYAPSPTPQAWVGTLAEDGPPPIDPAAVDAAATLLAGARRPLIWMGGGGRRAGAALRALLEVVPAGVITSVSGRGVLPEDHEGIVGAFVATAAGADLLARSDLLVAVGTHFRSNETRDLALPLPRRQVQIDLDPAALGRAYPCEVGILGEASQVLEALAGAVDRSGHAVEAGWRAEVAAARTEVRRAVEAQVGPQAGLCASLARHLPRGSVVCRDVTIPTSTWGNRSLPVDDWRSNLHAVGGGIGQGLAMGIGASVARPEVPTVVLAGDGGLAVGLGELATLAQERPRLVLVVFDDGGYGVLRNTQDVHLGRRSGVDLTTPDLAVVAEACGLPAQRVDDAEDFDEAVEAALHRTGPSVVVVDVEAVGPMPSPFVPPVKVG